MQPKNRETHFGKLLKQYREQEGHAAVKDLERKMEKDGFPNTSLGRYELGTRQPSGSLIFALQQCLKLTEDQTWALIEAQAIDYKLSLYEEFVEARRKLSKSSSVNRRARLRRQLVCEKAKKATQTRDQTISQCLGRQQAGVEGT